MYVAWDLKKLKKVKNENWNWKKTRTKNRKQEQSLAVHADIRDISGD